MYNVYLHFYNVKPFGLINWHMRTCFGIAVSGTMAHLNENWPFARCHYEFADTRHNLEIAFCPHSYSDYYFSLRSSCSWHVCISIGFRAFVTFLFWHAVSVKRRRLTYTTIAFSTFSFRFKLCMMAEDVEMCFCYHRLLCATTIRRKCRHTRAHFQVLPLREWND